jgi:Fe2+ transport system protein FeoA
MYLKDLKFNEKAIITNSINDNLPLKLMEMGLVEGVEIEFVDSALLGSPYYYKVGGMRIALGKEIVSLIEVTLVNGQNEKK